MKISTRFTYLCRSCVHGNQAHICRRRCQCGEYKLLHSYTETTDIDPPLQPEFIIGDKEITAEDQEWRFALFPLNSDQTNHVEFETLYGRSPKDHNVAGHSTCVHPPEGFLRRQRKHKSTTKTWTPINHVQVDCWPTSCCGTAKISLASS